MSGLPRPVAGVCARLLSAKTLTSAGSPRWILGSWLFDSLRFSDRWKVSHLSRVHQMSEGRKKWSHLLFLPWSRLPPTPSLESLPQIAFTQAFITQLKLCYCSWHSEWATTIAKQFILAFSSRRIYGKVSNPSTNGHVRFECEQLVVHSGHRLAVTYSFKGLKTFRRAVRKKSWSNISSSIHFKGIYRNIQLCKINYALYFWRLKQQLLVKQQQYTALIHTGSGFFLFLF